MHAVLVKVSISDVEGAQKELRETVVPRVSQLPGFVAGYWTKSEDGSNGRSMVIFESEEAARTAAERIGANVPEGVTFESAEVREVVANAQVGLIREHEWRVREGLKQRGRYPCNVERVRIAGVRLQAPVARLLSEILRAQGFVSTADRVADTIERRITIEAPLTLDDHRAILQALEHDCPSTLKMLRQRLSEEQRYVRRVTGE